ncbi:MAG: Hpt domain-containing protein, partial [Candidatus Obscuribacterales bacterium]|nr:Hpt domain-containing protein [Steroidobacteraceae bacterium]
MNVATQTLHIVARELNNELNDARAALENFGEQQDDVRFLENCRERLHHVYGALRVAEVHGAALLAEEMEHVARYLIDNFAEKRHLAEGLDALMRAMVQLPTYLERVLSGGRDMALILLPLLNDLRAVRGHALLSEGTLLLLNLSSEKQANPQAPAPGEHLLPVANWARKLRSRFQLGLLGWIKGERIEQNLETLTKSAEKLEQVATTKCVFQLWWVVGAVIEALRDGGLEGSASIKRLLGQADREMRRLYELGEQQYAERPPVELLNNLLYYVARTKAAGPRVAAVRASFRLSELLPVDAHVEAARESLAAPSVKLMKTVAAAIKEDLARVKDAFDLFVRQGAETGGAPASQLAPQLELLRKIGDTLGVLGLGELRDKVQAEIAELQTWIQQPASPNQALSEQRLMRIASTLINIEDSLDEQLVGLILPTVSDASDAGSSQPLDLEFRQVSEAVLRECIVNMARIKEAIALSVEKPREPQVLDQVPGLIRGITAGLLMLTKTRAVEIAEAIGRSLQRYVRADGTPVSREAMDRLADAIVAVEYYLETLHAGRTDPWYMLDNAEACLQALAEMSTDSTSSIHSLPDLGDHAATISVDHGATIALDRGERTQIVSTVQQVTQVIPTQKARQQASRVEPQSSAPPKVPVGAPPVLAKVAGKADAEFVELFIEEARDEIIKLQQLFPQWDENPQNVDALTNMRRSFHTLKGSGRMVGAMAIGELAWAIEGMLNRVINRTLERTPDMMTVLRETVIAVPELVEQLESGRAPKADVAALIARANQIAQVRESHARAKTSQDSAGKESHTDNDDPPPAAAAKPAAHPRNDAATMVLTPRAAASHAPATTSKPMVSLGASSAAPPIDAILNDIFSKETAGHLAAIRDYVGSCALLTAPYPVTEALHRACHTLRGAAKTAGARQGIKIAEPLNHYIRKLYDNGVGLPPAGLQVLKDSVRAMEMVVEHITEATGYFVTHQSIIERIAKLEQQLDLELTQMNVVGDSTVVTPTTELQPEVRGAQSAWVGDDVVELSFDAASENAELGIEPTRMTQALLASSFGSGETVDMPLDMSAFEKTTADLATFERTAPVSAAERTQRIHATPPREIIVETAAWAANYVPPTLPAENKSSVEPVGDVLEATEAHFFAQDADETGAYAVESVAMDITPVEIVLSSDEPETMEVSVPDFVEQLYAPTSATIIELSVLQLPLDEPGYELTEELLGESSDESMTVAETVIKPAVRFSAPQPVAATVAAPVSETVIDDIDAHESDEDENFDADVAAIFTEEAGELLDVADAAMSSWSRDRSNQATLFEFKRVVHTLKGGARMAGIRAMGDLTHELETFVEDVESGKIAAGQAVIDVLQASLDELHRMRDAVNSGKRVPQARSLISRLHSLAGRAPSAASTPAVAQPRKLVATPQAVVGEESIVIEPGMIEPVLVEMEKIAPTNHLNNLHSDEAAEADADLSAEFPAEELAAVPPRPITTALTDAASNDDELEVDTEEGDVARMALPPGREQVREERQEVARVDAELLDMLLNNAGEVSILRSRIEQQVNSVEFNLAELNRTVTRLKDQLRNLELETEAQILHRHQEDKGRRDDFDPLEMDRYSQIQQLSRALAESVSDVASIEALLESMTREAQNLLVQQSRVVTEVQNGLMRTRMVPFQRHVQRLSRIVRQVAAETGKRVELAVSGASGELDRQVLERMLPPFEHMLRNSVVHGIETPAERRAAGKSENGTIRIGLHREGSEMIIGVEDDGRGIDVKAVRERAVTRGLLKPGRTLTDEEALQLVLEPGFSTASSVTQHAGRGVGMDVVVAEIKKLGGALFTQSTAGQGVRFTIRLPFTLAIAQSLLVRVGEEQYALPLPTVEGVARVPRSEVLMHLRADQPSFNYGTQMYRLQHLGAFIGAPASLLPEADVPVPIILIR